MMYAVRNIRGLSYLYMKCGYSSSYTLPDPYMYKGKVEKGNTRCFILSQSHHHHYHESLLLILFLADSLLCSYYFIHTCSVCRAAISKVKNTYNTTLQGITMIFSVYLPVGVQFKSNTAYSRPHLAGERSHFLQKMVASAEDGGLPLRRARFPTKILIWHRRAML